MDFASVDHAMSPCSDCSDSELKRSTNHGPESAKIGRVTPADIAMPKTDGAIRSEIRVRKVPFDSGSYGRGPPWELYCHNPFPGAVRELRFLKIRKRAIGCFVLTHDF